MQQNVKLTGPTARILDAAVFGETPGLTPLLAPVLLGPVCGTFSIVTVVKLKWQLATFVVFRHKRTGF